MAGIKTTAVGAASGQRACKYQNAAQRPAVSSIVQLRPCRSGGFRRCLPACLPACYGKTSSLFFDYAVSTEFR